MEHFGPCGFFFPPRQCLIYAVCRWCGPPLRQTSIAKIRVGWLLKTFFTSCFVSPLRCAVSFMSPLHLSLQRAKGGVCTWPGLLMLAANSFQLTSTFLSWANEHHCIAWFWPCSSKASCEEQEENFLSHQKQYKKKKLSFIAGVGGGRSIRSYRSFL